MNDFLLKHSNLYRRLYYGWNLKKIQTAQQLKEANIDSNLMLFWGTLTGLFKKETSQAPVTNFGMPQTLAMARMESGARDYQAPQATKLFNGVKQQVKVFNQWFNPRDGLNGGYGSAHGATYLTQPLNFVKCYELVQDPMMARVLDLLSITPIAKRGIPTSSQDESDDDLKDDYAHEAMKFRLWETLEKAIRASYVSGGCLVYLDFGDDIDLDKPLNLKYADMSKFRGFKVIDVMYTAPVEVNTTEPAADDFMQPKMWYVIGLGIVHRSHFLKFAFNEAAAPLKPLFLFFGQPLTMLIMQDIANCNLTSQSVANLISRLRLTYLTSPITMLGTAQAQAFKQRLEAMAQIGNNYNYQPLLKDEHIEQLTMTTTGLPETVHLFFQLLAAKTGITISLLLGEGSKGMNGGGLEGERKNFYDNCRNTQRVIQENLLKMFGLVAGTRDGKYKHFDEFNWLPFEQASETEQAQNAKQLADAAMAFTQLGITNESVINWVKTHKNLNLDMLEVDDTADDAAGAEDYEALLQETLKGQQKPQEQQPQQPQQEKPNEEAKTKDLQSDDRLK